MVHSFRRGGPRGMRCQQLQNTAQWAAQSSTKSIPTPMLKRLLLAALLLPGIANAQFTNGQVLTATQLNNAFAATLPLAGGTLTGPLTVPSLSVTGSPIGLASGGTGATTGTGTGSVVLSNSPTVTGTYSSPFTVSGVSSTSDTGRSNNDNTPTVNLNISEALNYTASYATHYGFLLNATELTGGTGDRIGIGAIQTCNATLSGKSCVGIAGLAVAGGSAVGNYTGMNPRALVPAGLTGPVGAAVGMESDVETHSPVLIKNALRLSDENLSGGSTTHGSVEDAMIAFVNDSQNASQGFGILMQVGENPQGYPLSWPILAGGTIFQASNPNVSLAYGFDLSGSTAGFSKQAIALPQNTTGGGIWWGTAGTAGQISSSATTTGGFLFFTNAGISLRNPSNGEVLNVGGSTGADVINSGYMTESSLTGYVYCNGSSARCQASTNLGLAGTTGSIGGSALAAGACTSGTVSVTGSTTSMAVVATPATYPGDGIFWHGYVSTAGTVTVKVCASIAATPSASSYNVRVLQ